MIVAVGMDPGPKPGLVRLIYSDNVLIDVAVVQCTANVALDILNTWLITAPTPAELYFGGERFVDRQHGRADAVGNLTRDQLGSAVTAVQSASRNCVVALNSASRVKAWASLGRLKAAGLIVPTEGMRHARDGARHALFVAVHDAKRPDPYSRKARRTDG